MWVRKRLDIRWSDLAFGLLHAWLPADRWAAQRRVESAWSDSEGALACLSVRSGFDLLLSALALPPGSEGFFVACHHCFKSDGLSPFLNLPKP